MVTRSARPGRGPGPGPAATRVPGGLRSDRDGTVRNTVAPPGRAGPAGLGPPPAGPGAVGLGVGSLGLSRR
eukprot:503166-Hanusia_phi.AAC.1